MEKIYKNKNFFMIVMMVLFSVPFIYLLNLYPNKMTDASHWIFSFGISFSFLYIIFILSTLIQLFLVYFLRLFPIRIFTIYPLSYDGKWRVHPLRFLFNTEGCSNSLLLNLAHYINEESLLTKKLKKLLMIKKISYIISYGVIYIALFKYDIKTSLVFSICALTTILLSYFQYGDFWFGYDYVYSKGIPYLKKYLFSAKTISIISASDYIKELLNYDRDDLYLSLCCLENYLYKSILDKKLILKINEFVKIYNYYIRNDILYNNLNLDSKVQSIKRLIGWAGIQCADSSYISHSLDLLLEIVDYLEKNTISFISSKSTKSILVEIQYLRNYQNSSNYKLQLLYFHNIFSKYERIFQRH